MLLVKFKESHSKLIILYSFKHLKLVFFEGKKYRSKPNHRTL